MNFGSEQEDKITGPFREDTTPLMRPHQVIAAEEEKKRLEGTLNAAPHIANQIQDKPAMGKQLRKCITMLETQAPKPYATNNLDAAKKRELELIDIIKREMPTQAEMRKRPAGAVDKHRLFQKRNKQKILELKNIRLRLHASGDLHGVMPDSGDIANLEIFRPKGGSQELNMHGTLIEGTQYHGIDTARTVLFTDDDMEQIRKIDPEIADAMAVLPAEVRAGIKTIIQQTAKRLEGILHLKKKKTKDKKSSVVPENETPVESALE